MDLNEYNNRLESVIRDIQGGAHANVMIKVANDAIALIIKRVTQTGKKADGSSYKPYSKEPMWTNRSAMTDSAYQKVAGSKKKRKELRWITVKRNNKNIKLFELDKGYKEFRELHGRQTGFTDFVFKGDMMSNVALTMDQQQLQNGVAVIKPQSDEQYKKMEGNVQKRGKILDLSPEEIKILSNIYNNGILQIFRDNGL